MTILFLLIGLTLLFSEIESAEIDIACIDLVLEEIELRQGPIHAYLAAGKISKGYEWWEV